MNMLSRPGGDGNRGAGLRGRGLFRCGVSALAVVGGSAAFGQTVTPDKAWTLLPELPEVVKAAEAWVRPKTGQVLVADLARIRDILKGAPLEFSPDADKPLIIELPDPTGALQKFAVLESPVMEPGLAARFPDISTFVGRGITDPHATLRADVTMHGFHAQVLTASDDGLSRSWYIDPASFGDTEHYTSYFRRDLRTTTPWTCSAPVLDNIPLHVRGGGAGGGGGGGDPQPISGTTLRTYRLACAATGEYTAFHGGSVSAGQAAIVTAINRVNGVYEKDVTIRMILVANNSSLVYTNSGTDPYSNGSGSAMLSQNQSTVDSVIGSANYDIGHVFSTGGGGIAGLGVVCIGGNKARGVTGSSAPTGDPFYIDYVAHEMGHQFGANHTFNGTASSCSGNRAGSAAYEPGSGSTIMGYAGICGSDNLQSNSDAYFHFKSHDEIINFVSGTGCAATAATGNSVPTVNAGPDRAIPRGTPFVLTATASDGNGDALTYCWEEYDLGPGATLATADQGTIPLFRSYSPSSSPTRYFPQLSRVLTNTSSNQEKLPQVARTFNVRCTVRDSRTGGGGVNSDLAQLAVSGTAGPFTVTSQSTATSWTGGTSQTITWNVAGTAASPVSCADVAILLSTNNGLSFSTTLLATTPNDGSEVITVPNVSTSGGRIMVQSIGNVFFNVNLGTITITPGGCVGATVSTQPTSQTGCVGWSASLSLIGGGTAPLGYQWRKGGVNVSGATGATLSFASLAAGDAGNYDCIVSNSCGSAASNTVTLTVNTPVSISTSPSSLTRCAGQSASFTVSASGSPAPSYQWRKNGSNIGGATSGTYSIASVSGSDAGDYTCVVTNPCGSQTSAAATLTIGTTPSITLPPLSQTVCEGDAASFLIGATGGGPFTYQWRLNGNDIPGATGPNYSINPIEPDDDGEYTCRVTNGCGSTISPAGVLTVRDYPLVTSPPTAQSGCTGGSATFAVGATGDAPLAFQWRKNGSNIDGATSATLNLTGLTADSGGSYDCAITNTCGSVTSSAAILTVDVPPGITTHPSSAAACVGAGASFGIAATGSPAPTFQWRRNGTPIDGATSATYSIAAVSASDDASYDCIVTNPCGSAVSDAATLRVDSVPAITGQPAAVSPCEGQPASFSIAATSTPAPGFQWRLGGVNIPGATSSTYDIAAASPADAGTYDCVVTNPCGSVTSEPAVLELSTAPVISGQPTATGSCEGGEVSLTVLASGTAPLVYQWRRAGAPIPGADGATLVLSPLAIAEAGMYDCVVSNGCGSTTSEPAEVSVLSGPVIGTQPSGQSVCAGQTAVFSVAATGASAYQWRRNGVPVADGPSGTGSSFSGANTAVLTIAAAAPGDGGDYRCTVSASCGEVTSDAAGLVVGAGPSISQEPVGQVVCAGAAITLSVSAAGGVPLEYQWRRNSDPIGGATLSTYGVVAASAADAGAYDCVVSDPCGSITSQAAIVQVCIADFNCSGAVSVQDIFDFMAGYFAGDPRADVNGSGVISVQDIFDFLAAYFAGCA